MYLKTALEIIVAFFCVIGIYSFWRFITQKIFGEKNIVVAVEITTERDAEKAESLIMEAFDTFLAIRSQKIVVFTVQEYEFNENLTAAVKKYGVPLYVIKDK